MNLTLEAGRSLALVGESGSGKSTLARIICALEKPDSGEVEILGKPVIGISKKDLRNVYKHVQMVFQNPSDSFNPRRKLGESIIDAAANAGIDDKTAHERIPSLLAEVGLPAAYADRYPSQVSGGECQRAAIARAMAFGSELLICDESTSALDVLVQSQIINLLNDLRTTHHVSLFFICHDLAIVRDVADDVAVMLRGNIVERGPVDKVIGKAVHPYTQLMQLSVFPTKPHTGWRIPHVEERPVEFAGEKALSGCPFYARCPQATDVCASQMPPSIEVSDRHYVSCWHVQP